MKNHVQSGKTLTFPAAPYTVAAGAGFQVGGLFAVAVNAAASGAPVQGNLTEVYTLPKATGSNWTLGEVIYWDNTNKVCTDSASGNLKIGHAVEVAGSSATSGVVRLNGAY